jgi:hypothetical protein
MQHSYLQGEQSEHEEKRAQEEHEQEEHRQEPLSPSRRRLVDSTSPIQAAGALGADDAHPVVDAVAGLAVPRIEPPVGLAGVNLPALPPLKTPQDFAAPIATRH